MKRGWVLLDLTRSRGGIFYYASWLPGYFTTLEIHKDFLLTESYGSAWAFGCLVGRGRRFGNIASYPYHTTKALFENAEHSVAKFKGESRSEKYTVLYYCKIRILPQPDKSAQ